ncbi:MAG: tight adherence protein, partial [Actinomycetota bacterium]|nr:tight adherence protein [Actinomycetota bacterium]
RRLADALTAADVRCDATVALQSWALAALVAAALGSVFSFVFGALAALGVIVGGPLGLRAARGRGRRRAAAAVPDALERCAMELRGGGTIATAIDALAAHEGPLAVDFAHVRDRFALGASLDDAIARWADERDAPGVRAAAGALALGASVGGACADALDGLAASLRARLAVMAEARALSAQARLSAMVVGAAPVGYLAWSALVDPGPLASLVGSMAGRVCLLLAVTLEALAVVWMLRVLREESAWS